MICVEPRTLWSQNRSQVFRLSRRRLLFPSCGQQQVNHTSVKKFAYGRTRAQQESRLGPITQSPLGGGPSTLSCVRFGGGCSVVSPW